MTESNQQKPKWYSVRPGLLYYSQRQLARMAGINLAVAAVLALFAVVGPEGQRTNLIGAACTWLGLSIAPFGTWVYRRRKGSPEQQPTHSQPNPHLYGFVASFVIIGGFGVLWAILLRQGATSEDIAAWFAASGSIVLLACIGVMLFMKLRSRNQ